jgi:hypothetical protein
MAEADAISISGGDGFFGPWYWMSQQYLQNQICDGNRANLAAINFAHSDIARSICGSTADIIKSVCDSSAMTNANICDTKTAVLLSAKDAALQLANVRAELAQQASDNYAQLQLAACQNQNALSRQLSDCCCELKKEISASARETQKMLTDAETQRLRDELADERQKNLINRLGNHGHC